ncbi:leucine--tRNA ligase [Candidatus Campbellbacteria bacterium CG22_combo_CG10-13_8_21_14_all_36_13]|uniref:Leucine--tRNA ligase n=1 Tax=Candidatus Campbellbacteria bacterium CG22_combo_CG10-13_8_21_14_all_36_13 TaxID=1974529 RepID=A0A2H0DYW0_9BACT|nr:MAG: leucine--tRNA ligase [Candidatus Campbellbacteria bacterium CG22_combo_CG10-13_8_21_14_all_36_13]
MSEYNHKEIESKWQKKWSEKKVYETGIEGKEKCYVLDMFPYPSGSGLHVGHPKGYIATDIYSRYKRANGYDVLHPMGWDAFGLPAENYAIKTQIHPQETTEKAIVNFKEQIKGLSLSYDWDREINTSSPEYYRWTQWIFLQLYKNGLAYKKNAKVNWCESCKTVLANEQVVNGGCDRCGNVVIQKELPQWFFKITDFSDELIDDLDALDWPESTKISQKNWIGRSSGAEIEFQLAASTRTNVDWTQTNTDKNSVGSIKVFTTRPDTLFGATYVVLAPEHPLLEELKDSIENFVYVEKYTKKAINKTDLERISEGKNKTGIILEGVIVINPANGKEIPVFVADYVLGGYGTGAIMAVPAHDERDNEFAKKYDLEIIEVVDEVGVLKNSGEFDGLSFEEAKIKITEKVGGSIKTTYRLRDWLVSRQRYWGAPIPIIFCDKCGEVSVPEADLPVVLPTDVDFMPTGESPIEKSESFHNIKCPSCGGSARRESDTLDTFVCSSWYYLRFTDPNNFKEFASKPSIKRWMPVDVYVGGAEHTVLHLLYARFITKALQKIGHVDFKEPFLSLRHQGLIIAEDGRKMSKSFGNVVNPDDVIDTYGADSMRLYEMFMGPFNDSISWNTKNILGVRRFVEKVWRISEFITDKSNQEEDRIIHTTVKKVGDDIQDFKFNTAISALMVCAKHLEEQKSVSKENFKMFIQILAPFAPHLSEELWSIYIGEGLIVKSRWPKYDENKIKSENINIAVQINGKVRAVLEVGLSESEEDVVGKALKINSIQKYAEGFNIKKTIYIKGKVLNIVVM